MENQNNQTQNLNPNPPVPPVSNTSQTQQPIENPKPKVSIAAIIGILIFLLLAGGAAASFTVLKPQIMKLVAKSSPTPAPIVTITPTPDPTADWKTYTDQKLNFSLKYPSEVSIKRTLDEGGVEFGIGKSADPNYVGFDILSVYFRTTAGNDPETVFRTTECPSLQGKTCQEKTEAVKINNAVGIKTLGPNYPSGDNYYLTNESKTFPVIRLTYSKSNNTPKQDIKIFEQVLSTFKFTDSSNVHTFNNGIYSFEYPSNFFVYDYKDVNNSVAISDIPNPQEIPQKVSEDKHTIVQVSFYRGEIPKCFNYTNGGTSCTNSTIKPYTSSQGYSGIRGNQTSTLGLNDVVYLKKDSTSYSEIIYELGDKKLFDQILSTFKFSN